MQLNPTLQLLPHLALLHIALLYLALLRLQQQLMMTMMTTITWKTTGGRMVKEALLAQSGGAVTH